MNTTEDLAVTAFDLATQAALKYLQSNSQEADVEALTSTLKHWVKTMLPSALENARQAFDCNMDEIAVATFKASMTIAGIEAAKESGFPVGWHTKEGIVAEIIR